MHTKTTKTFVMLTNFRNFGYDELTIHTEMKEKGIVENINVDCN